MDVVLLFPGQGSQKPGMGKDLADEFPAAKDVFDQADRALGSAISGLCFDGPAEELTLTHNAQPALLTHGAAVWAATRDVIGTSVKAAAGHSLGELTAYHAAGALDLADAVRTVRRRGELMYESGVKRPGAMAAILGDTRRTIEEICDEATRDSGLVVPANYNGPGQVVLSGEAAGVDRAMALAKDAGAKLAVRLNVSGAFHSPLMESAVAGLAEVLEGTAFEDPHFPVYANVNCEPVTAAARGKQLLLEQLSKPVRWSDVIRALQERFPSALYVEMGPGSVLVGLVKRIAPALKTMACGTAADVRTLHEMAAAPVLRPALRSDSDVGSEAT
jgi:[acyl-carrier-protein] S-malonyltransferase